MKSGSLVKIIDPSESMKGLDAMISKTRSFGNIGKSGIVLSEYEHRTATCDRVWYTVLIDGAERHFREDYLRVSEHVRS